jgi:MFS family permease
VPAEALGVPAHRGDVEVLVAVREGGGVRVHVVDRAADRGPAAEHLARAFGFLGKRWTAMILGHLSHGPAGFRDLSRGIGGISDSVLSERLAGLAAGGLISREVCDGPPRDRHLPADQAGPRPDARARPDRPVGARQPAAGELRNRPVRLARRVPVWSAVSAVRDAAGPYRRLLGQPVLRGLAVADVCARLPQGMVSITLLLAAAQTSMAAAGLVVAAYTLGQAVTGPVRGRMADRYGLGRVCALCGGGYALAMSGVLAGSLARGPALLLVTAGAAAGLMVPPLSPGMRSLWSAHATAALRSAAFALDAAVFDLTAITGPVLASSLATGVGPAASVGLLLALTGVAIVIVGAHSRPAGSRDGGHPAHARRPALGPLHSPALRRLLVTGTLVNAALSMTEVALTAYVRHYHALWAAGPLLAGVSAGSIAGSLLLGTRAQPAQAYRRLPRLLARYAFGLAVLAVACLYPPLLAVAAPLAGLCLGPSLATLFSLASGAAPGGGTEAQGWLNSAMNGGAAAGAAVAGIAASRPLLSLALAAVIAAAAAASSGPTWAARRAPRP